MKTCSCGHRFTVSEWAALPALADHQIVVPSNYEEECDCQTNELVDHTVSCAGRGFTIELVNCPACHSTLAREVL